MIEFGVKSLYVSQHLDDSYSKLFKLQATIHKYSIVPNVT